MTDEQMRKMLIAHDRIFMGSLDDSGKWIAGLLSQFAEMTKSLRTQNRLLIAIVVLFAVVAFKVDIWPLFQGYFK